MKKKTPDYYTAYSMRLLYVVIVSVVNVKFDRYSLIISEKGKMSIYSKFPLGYCCAEFRHSRRLKYRCRVPVRLSLETCKHYVVKEEKKKNCFEKVSTRRRCLHNLLLNSRQAVIVVRTRLTLIIARVKIKVNYNTTC